MTPKYYRLTLSAFLTVATLVIMAALAAAAHAASLKVCYNGVTADVADINLYVNNVQAVDVFPGQTQGDGSICATISPVPTPVLRGTVQSYTLKAVNSIGEEGPASNALSFRYPQVPAAPTLLSVGTVVP